MVVVVACCYADAGPDLFTLCPDLCTLCLWFFPSFSWCKYSTCSGGGCHQLQLALVVPFNAATSADSPTCTHGGITLGILRWWCFFIQPLVQILHLHSGNLHRVVVLQNIIAHCSLCLCRVTGHKPYLMPTGGSNATGVWGYIECFREMLDQVGVGCTGRGQVTAPTLHFPTVG